MRFITALLYKITDHFCEFGLTGVLFLDNKTRGMMNKSGMILICLFCFSGYWLIFWIQLFLSMSSKDNVLIKHSNTVSFCWELSPNCIWLKMLLFLLTSLTIYSIIMNTSTPHYNTEFQNDGASQSASELIVPICNPTWDKSHTVNGPFWKHLRSLVDQSHLDWASLF